MPFHPDHFVNRDSEIHRFATLGQGTERILVFHGPLGIGKSALLQRLRHDCRTQGVPCVLLDLSSSSLADIDTLIDELAFSLGGPVADAVEEEQDRQEQALTAPQAQQALLSELLQPASGPATPGVPASIQFTAGDIGAGAQIAAGQNIIQFNNSPVNLAPEAEPARLRERRLRRLTRVLRTGLLELLQQQPAVLFFDTCDDASQELLAWLETALLMPLVQQELAGTHSLSVVLAGDPTARRGPWIQGISGWSYGVLPQALANLLPDDVRRYWVELRRIDENLLPPAFLLSGAPPSLLQQMADLSAPLSGAVDG